MNCKQGDIAIIQASDPKYNGRIVEVLYAPPRKYFTLPDGYPCIHDASEPCWVLKFIGGRTPAPLSNGGTRQTLYGVGADRALRPLRDDPDATDQPVEDELTIS